MNKLLVYNNPKDPSSEVDYGMNWGDSAEGDPGWLLNTETVITSTWAITSDTETVPTLVISAQGSSISTNGKITKVFLSGGTEGVNYRVTNHIVTSNTANSDVRNEFRTGIIFCCKK